MCIDVAAKVPDNPVIFFVLFLMPLIFIIGWKGDGETKFYISSVHRSVLVFQSEKQRRIIMKRKQM